MKKPTIVTILILITVAAYVSVDRGRSTENARNALPVKQSNTKFDRDRSADRHPSSGDLSPAQFDDFVRRPFKPAISNDRFEWTSEDGRLKPVIRNLAHNALEESRMVGENKAVHKRQLVYIRQSLSDAIARAESDGSSFVSHSVPSFDGQELEVDVVKVDRAVSGVDGVVYGKLRGVPDSTVTISYADKSECFSVLSPSDDMFLQGDPREPGEIIVKAFDPGRMGLDCGQHVKPYSVGE